METAFVKVPVTLALRPFIDEAIHSVIENAVLQAGLSNGPVFRCADYAIVGARVLGKLTGHSYLAVAGKAIMDCGAGRFLLLSPTRTARRQAATLSQVVGYHCWIQSLHPVGGAGPRLEMIDFTVRHDWATAKALGVPFTAVRTNPICGTGAMRSDRFLQSFASAWVPAGERSAGCARMPIALGSCANTKGNTMPHSRD
jgi:hypothetical protein